MVVVPIVDRIIPPKPPVPVPVVKPVTPVAPATPAPVRPDIVQPVVEQVVVDQGTLQAEETVVPATDAGTGDIAPPAGPVAGVRLQYADAPSPPYPSAALRAGLQGPVLLQVLVDVAGRPLQVDVEHSSGYRVLANAARRYALQHRTFRPAMRDGRPGPAGGAVRAPSTP